MSKPLFHSFYNDSTNSSVKHALFYYGEIAVPVDSFVFGSDTKVEDIGFHYIQMLNERMCTDFEFLEDEGVAELVTFPQNIDLKPLHEIVARTINSYEIKRSYGLSHIEPICDFLHIDSSHESSLEVINYVSTHIAITCLSSILGYGYLPCVDNQIISDTIAIGMMGVINESFRHLDSFQLKRLRDRAFAQKVNSIALPSFKFKSFHEVLELRERLLGQLNNLKSGLHQISQDLTLNPWDKGYNNEVETFIKKYVEPEIEALKQKSKFRLSNVAKQVVGAGVIFEFQSVLPETLAKYVVGGSVVSVLNSVKSEHERTKAELNNNSFGVLLNL